MNLEDRIASLALKAMLYEVSASPKPGLVDTLDAGSHVDMDYFTFIDSACVLTPYFKACARQGFLDENMDKALLRLRPLGIEAEKNMLEATKGVNTHKGLIYALGLNAYAASFVLKSAREATWLDQIGQLVSRIVLEEAQEIHDDLKFAQTYGGQQFRQFGLLGARGESSQGYLSARNIGYKALVEGVRNKEYSFNHAMLFALLHLIVEVDDTNAIGRCGLAGLEESKAKAKSILNLGFIKTQQGKDAYHDYIEWSKQCNISHGGAADLLAVSLFYYFLEEIATSDLF